MPGNQGDRGREGVVVDDPTRAIVGEHLDEDRDLPLGARRDREPRQGAVPSVEGHHDEVVALGEVGFLMLDHRTQLTRVEESHETGGEHRDGRVALITDRRDALVDRILVLVTHHSTDLRLNDRRCIIDRPSIKYLEYAVNSLGTRENSPYGAGRSH